MNENKDTGSKLEPKLISDIKGEFYYSVIKYYKSKFY